jgi:hypothetical protein
MTHRLSVYTCHVKQNKIDMMVSNESRLKVDIGTIAYTPVTSGNTV